MEYTMSNTYTLSYMYNTVNTMLCEGTGKFYTICNMHLEREDSKMTTGRISSKPTCNITANNFHVFWSIKLFKEIVFILYTNCIYKMHYALCCGIRLFVSFQVLYTDLIPTFLVLYACKTISLTKRFKSIIVIQNDSNILCYHSLIKS